MTEDQAKIIELSAILNEMTNHIGYLEKVIDVLIGDKNEKRN